jgi:hypothetical protein
MIATLGEVRRVNVGFVEGTTFIFIGGVPTLGNCVRVATLGICVGVATLGICVGVATLGICVGVATLKIWLGVATLGICVGVVTLVFGISTTDSSLMMCGTCPGVEYG